MNYFQDLDGFDKDVTDGKTALEEDLDSGMAETVDENNKDNDTPKTPESNQIKILDMTTWSSPVNSPGIQPTPFTISEQLEAAQNEQKHIDAQSASDDKESTEDYGVDF